MYLNLFGGDTPKRHYFRRLGDGRRVEPFLLVLRRNSAKGGDEVRVQFECLA